MKTWKKFFGVLSELAAAIFPPALALYVLAANAAFPKSSPIIKITAPFWEEPAFNALKAAAGFVSPYLLVAGLFSLFCFVVGPESFTRRAKILWLAAWVFLIFSAALFLFGLADPAKLPVWPAVINLILETIALFRNIFSFNIYVGWAAGIAFVYSLIIFVKDLAEAFLNYGAGILDRRVRPILAEELKMALGLRMIKTAADLVPITPPLLTLIFAIFAVGAFPMFLAARFFPSYGIASVLNLLGAAIMTYGFVQIFGIILIFLTGLVYFLAKRSRPLTPPRTQF